MLSGGLGQPIWCDRSWEGSDVHQSVGPDVDDLGNSDCVPSAHDQAASDDVRIAAEEMLRMRTLLSQILAECTDQPFEKVDRDVERDFILSPSQAVEYGLIDGVLSVRDLETLTRPTVGVGS